MGAFVPAQNRLISEGEVLGWDAGPLCECDAYCSAQLPLRAWLFSGNVGQAVVLPGHQRAGARVVEMDGFNVEEEDT